MLMNSGSLSSSSVSSFCGRTYSHHVSDVLTSFLVDTRDTVGKVLLLKGAPQQQQQYDDSVYDVLAFDVCSVLASVHWSLTDGSELTAGQIRASIDTFRRRNGKHAHREAMIAAVAHTAAVHAKRSMAPMSERMQHNVAGGTLLDTFRPPLDVPISNVLQSLSALSRHIISHLPMLLPRCHATSLTFQPVTSGNERSSNILAALRRQLGSVGQLPLQDSEWCAIAASLAASTIAELMENGVSEDVQRDWLYRIPESTWEAMVSIFPRIGLSATQSCVIAGCCAVVQQRDCIWAPPPTNAMWRRVQRPTEQRSRHSGVGMHRDAWFPMTHFDIVILLSELTIASECASADTVRKLSAAVHSWRRAVGASGTLVTSVLLVVEDDLTADTRRWLEMWSSEMIAWCVVSAVGKALHFRLATVIGELPFADVDALVSDGLLSNTEHDSYHFAWTPTSVCFEALWGVGQDAESYSSTQRRTMHCSDVIVSFRPAAATESVEQNTTACTHAKYVTVMIAAPAVAVVHALTSNFWTQLAAAREVALHDVFLPDQGLVMAACSVLAEHFTDQMRGTAMTSADPSMLTAVALAESLSIAWGDALARILEQSYGCCVEAAVKRVSVCKAALHEVCNEQLASTPQLPLYRRPVDLYRAFVSTPPLFEPGGTIDGESEADLSDWRPVTVLMADIAGWISLDSAESMVHHTVELMATMFTSGAVTLVGYRM